MADTNKIREAMSKRDPVALLEAAGSDIGALKAAEDVIAARAKAEDKGPGKFVLASQGLVGWLALIGVALNVFQMYSNRKQFEQQRTSEEARWRSEFDRAQAADKHNAFLQVSGLITDGQVDRRLLGYALLGEFMGDKDYYDKAQLMLEERMLAETQDKQFDEQHRNALRVIVRTLSATKDCDALIKGASAIHKLKKVRDLQLSGDDGIDTPVEELYADFVRYIYGHALVVCSGKPDELKQVRTEIRVALEPYVKGTSDREKKIAGNKLVAQYLRDRCFDEPQGGQNECVTLFTAFESHCKELEKDVKQKAQWELEKESCNVAGAALVELKHRAALAVVTPEEGHHEGAPGAQGAPQ